MGGWRGCKCWWLWGRPPVAVAGVSSLLLMPYTPHHATTHTNTGKQTGGRPIRSTPQRVKQPQASRSIAMAGPNPPALPLESPSPAAAAAAAAAEGAQQQVAAAAAGAAAAAAANGSDKGTAWERLLAEAGDDLLTCVFEFLQVAELATA